MSDFGAKQTCRKGRQRLDLTKMTLSGYRPDQNFALQQPQPSNA
jgi:hypothetical protein